VFTVDAQLFHHLLRLSLQKVRKGGQHMKTISTTLLDLVQVVSEYARTDAEVVATVAALINSGKVRLCGNFAGAYIYLDANDTNTAPSWPIMKEAA
jgi:hypothetical protein